MEQKSFHVAEVKAVGATGEFEALVSVFNNVDLGNERVLPGAFSKAVREQPPPPVVWSHMWGVPPIGETLDWGETDRGLVVKGRLFVDQEDDHAVAKQVYAAMKSRQGRPPALREFSFSYDVAAEETAADGVRDLKELYPVHEVGPCLRGMNPATELIAAPKSAQLVLPSFVSTLGTATANASWAFVPMQPPSLKLQDDTPDEGVTAKSDPFRRVEMLELGLGL